MLCNNKLYWGQKKIIFCDFPQKMKKTLFARNINPWLSTDMILTQKVNTILNRKQQKKQERKSLLARRIDENIFSTPISR